MTEHLLALVLIMTSVATPESKSSRAACVACHPAQAKLQPATSMAHALETISGASTLAEHPKLTLQAGSYSYRIERKGEQSIYSVSDGEKEISAPLLWALGLGSAGQTYIFKMDDQLYESRVSFYRETGGLDLTLGANGSEPKSLLEAAGEVIKRSDSVRCFGCHATHAFEGKQLTLEKMTPGVQCERCHGSSEEHLKSVKTAGAKLVPMKKLSDHSTEQTSNFCGQCHRTWEEIAAGGGHGIVNVRFQPYGLTNSKCYDTDDKRISCIACHDPHQEVERHDANYDSRCLACHLNGGKASAKVCHVAKQDCVSCHMPKVELPGAHHRFTDHEIRIVRASAKAGG